MKIHSFLDPVSQTFSHLLVDEVSSQCAIIDPVLAFDEKSAQTNTYHADQLIALINENNWQLQYIIETHAHADHISGAAHIKQQLGGKTVMSKYITQVQDVFKRIYNFDSSFKTDASQFDVLTDDGDLLSVGNIAITVLHVSGHTPADMAYSAKNTLDASQPIAVFVGDTLFAPDVGTARCDFPGGDAVTLYRSIKRLLSLPDDTLLYLCHDYPPATRNPLSYVTVKAQKQHNIHVNDAVTEAEFVKMREARDATLAMPKLIIPAIQLNIQAGELPAAESNGIRYLRVPLNTL